ncbi:SDR family NAD(P)-dependent oxidoreductase [Radicibacter daui]|uniref:SDR family NAD(P)-dependent oxidoreductase n=1 Tax=Radicibacter daui TaxID=3064829 RepID=UPI004046A514
MAPHILITGASSGLGAAIAESYAQPGTNLTLQGRDAARLEKVSTLCRNKGAAVVLAIDDVCDQTAMGALIEEAEARQPLTLVIANAGISGGTAGGSEGQQQAREIFDTNLTGVLNTVLPVIDPMKERRGGQIALMASLAGYRGLPGAPAYSASKAAVRAWGEALRGHLAPFGIKVNVICPGFVDTPLTRVNRFPMPFLMTAERAASIIRKGLDANRGRIAFPWPMATMVWALMALPDRLAGWLTSRAPRKG